MRALILLAFLGAANVYEARVLHVIDGDTIRLAVAIWPDTEVTTTIRLRGVDAPELKGRCPEEKSLAVKAKAFVAEMLPPGARVTVSRIKPDKYGGRFDGDVLVSGRSLRDLLIAEGLARPYSGGKRQGWC